MSEPQWVELRQGNEPTGKLLAKYDPKRGLLEIQQRGIKTLFDLTRYKESYIIKGKESVSD